ncbi:hypothetical protein [Sodalis-like endosymbiont of Proechinophthirus fluctus]|nr:hypothetical protein [Sodalis-like endosymbiont of Proechinophthirus fluctus]
MPQCLISERQFAAFSNSYLLDFCMGMKKVNLPTHGLAMPIRFVRFISLT